MPNYEIVSVTMKFPPNTKYQDRLNAAIQYSVEWDVEVLFGYVHSKDEVCVMSVKGHNVSTVSKGSPHGF